LVGCETGPSVTQTEAPPPTAAYRFEFTPPEKASKKTEITIGIVAPNWEKRTEASPWLDVGINPDPNELMTFPNLAAHTGPAPQELRAIGSDFHKAVQKDYEAMLVARGFPTMGPFANVDDMTYPQKTACNLIIVPEFSQTIRSKPSVVNTDVIQGTATIRTEIVLTVYEPLSKEKLWIKRFDNESKPFSYKVKYNIERLSDKDGNKTGVQRKGITWDNRPAGFAQGFMDLHQEFMNKSWAYFSPEEMAVLKQNSDEIRAKKRF
jgi:hypothetical protein